MSSLPPLETIIDRLALVPHPEGGYYRETYRDSGTIPGTALRATHEGERSFSTAIYYLLAQGQISRWHRLRSDEIWHFYDGGPVTVAFLEEGAGLKLFRMGAGSDADPCYQLVIPKNTWFGAICDAGTPYTLVGCTVAPGFDFRDFEIAKPEQLHTRFPEAREWIDRLTP